jgi:CIC family chloride channel protein
MRSPFTGIVFAIELTHDLNMLLPLLVASFLAHGFTVLVLKRSILTEKISRRGYHLSREYAVDALEILFVREVMRTNVVALPANATLEETRELVRPSKRPHGQHVFPVVDENEQLLGVISRNDLLRRFEDAQPKLASVRLVDIVTDELTVAYRDEPLRVVVYRMAESGHTRMPVVEAEDEKRLLGMVSLDDLLRARSRNLEEERRRERLLRLRLPLGKATNPVTQG